MKEKRDPPSPPDRVVGVKASRRAGGGRSERATERRAVSPFVAVLALLLALTSMVLTFLSGGFQDPGETLREFFRDPTPHEAYLLGLSQSGLVTSALGQDWMEAAREALVHPLPTDLPHQEEVFFSPDEAAAVGYRISLRRGQRLSVTMAFEGVRDTRVFVDLFRVAPDTVRLPVHVSSPEPGEPLVFEPRRTSDFILRVQPELLRGGRFRITLEDAPVLAFPVSGGSHRAIGSFFGDSRDGGRRDHHGVDIFAPRGTPVVAAADAYVRRTDTTSIGGRVIWLRDSQRSASIYYAHLNEILVEAGSRVSTGDTIGTVGNTGNARTTPPHLHFGIYLRGEGPYDPWDFLYRSEGPAPAVRVAVSELGRWARTRGDRISLRDRPSAGGHVLAELPGHTALRLLGGAGEWYRVRLPDGASGWVAGRLTEDMGEPIGLERVARARAIQSDPIPGAPVMDQVSEGAELSILATFGKFLLVQPGARRPGWIMGSVPGPT